MSEALRSGDDGAQRVRNGGVAGIGVPAAHSRWREDYWDYFFGWHTYLGTGIGWWMVDKLLVNMVEVQVEWGR